MKLTIERAALLKALGHVQSVVERRNTIPILSNILLSADGSTLSFSATDLDMEIIDEGSLRSTSPARSPRRPTRSMKSSASCPTAPTSR
jgi:DNA polymerase-3 subunit beta